MPLLLVAVVNQSNVTFESIIPNISQFLSQWRLSSISLFLRNVIERLVRERFFAVKFLSSVVGF